MEISKQCNQTVNLRQRPLLNVFIVFNVFTYVWFDAAAPIIQNKFLPRETIKER